MKNNNQLIICDIDGTLIDLDNHFLQGFNNKLEEIGLANYQLSLEEYIDCVITGSGFKDIGNLLLFKKGLLWKKPFQLQKIKAALMDFYPKLVEEVLKNNAPLTLCFIAVTYA